ncbi:hypothetical protein ACO0QE_002115 [Hanseniaspora vineae]
MSGAETTQGKRLPLWVLSQNEEHKARQNLKKMAYEKCDEYVKGMVECSKQHGLKVFPACNGPRDKMAECLLFYQTDKYLDHQKDLLVEERISKLEEQLKNQQKQ